MVSRTPVDRPLSSTSSAVTAAMAAPRNNVRRRCCTRLRMAIVRSTNSLDMASPLALLLFFLHGLSGGDPHGDPGRVEAGKGAHQQHDGEGRDDVAGADEGIQARTGEEEEPDVRLGG